MARELLNSVKTLFAALLLISSISNLNAQKDDINLMDKYVDYTNTPREIAYVHLNKSTFVKGEDLGFTAYVLDKKDKKLSNLTTNL